MLYEDDEFDDEFNDEFDELFENVSYLYYDDDSIEISREEREKRVLHRLRPVPAFTCPALVLPAFLGELKLQTFPSPEKSNRGKTVSQRNRLPRLLNAGGREKEDFASRPRSRFLMVNWRFSCFSRPNRPRTRISQAAAPPSRLLRFPKKPGHILRLL